MAGQLANAFEGFGTLFRLVADDVDVFSRAERCARSLGWNERDDTGQHIELAYELRASPPGHPEPRFVLYCAGVLICQTGDPDALLDAFENHAKIETADRAKDRLFVHAGAVSWRGRAIVLPGRSRTGKSTLVKALVDAGAGYYSDEFAVLDTDSRVRPYRLPLALRVNGGPARTRIAVDRLGSPAGDRALPIGLIVVTEYEPRARWRPRMLSPGESMLALMEHTVSARRAPDRAMAMLRDAILSTKVVKSRRGDARATARTILAGIP